MYIADIEEAVSRIAAAPFVPDAFPFDFIAAYDAPPATITRIRNGTQNASDLDGGVLWRQKLHTLVCGEGQVADALARLQGSRATTTQKAKFLLATDGVEVAARDIEADDTIFFPFSDIGNRFGFFLPLAGYSRYKAADDNPIDVKAANRLRRLYDALIAENPEWEGDDMRHAMNLFMTRIIFCMFAEDTGIIPEHLFARTIHDHGGHSGEEMVHVLTSIFTAMSIRENERGEMPQWASRFPWVNGGLFAGEIEVPRFSRTAFRTLTDAAGLRWNEINADIFGSMIQVIVDPAHRHETGMHYTSVPNILKVLDPLFLDELRMEAARPALADNSREKARLKALLMRLSKIRVFDPACGSGNFLVIAYQELRKIERQVLDRLRAITGLAPGIWSHIELHNFYGIELSDFAAETAKLSLWIAKFQMDRAHRDVFGTAPPALPLSDSGMIVCANALQVDWRDICPPAMATLHRQKVLDLAEVVEADGMGPVLDKAAETFIIGNPPYLGFNFQSASQKRELEGLFRGRTPVWKSLDYVSCWFLKGADYCRSDPQAACAFVATNSICQGQQVPMLWPALLSDNIRISFAHLSFKWANSAANTAAVMCVIVGLTTKSGSQSLLIDDAHSRSVSQISPYLTDGPTMYVHKRSLPLSAVPPMFWGNKPTDGGNLLMSSSDRSSLIEKNENAAKYIHRFVGSDECINGIDRYCIWVSDEQRADAETIPEFKRRFDAVAAFRASSVAAQTRPAAAYPHRFRQIQSTARESTIIVPKVSSERRRYLPVDYLSNGEIISDNAFALYDAPLWTLSIVASRLHLIWIEAVCGKLETRFRYSNTMGWHTFPIPPLSNIDAERLTACAEDILLARAEAGGTIAELYDPERMPEALREAHHSNDRLLERIYSDRPFRSDADRFNHLLRRYAKMTAADRGEQVAPEFELASEDESA